MKLITRAVATFIATLILGFAVLNYIENQSLKADNAALLERLATAETQRADTNEALADLEDATRALIRRNRQLERFIRSLGLEPPTQASSQADGSDSGPSDEEPKPEHSPDPKPPGNPDPPNPPPGPGPLDEVCDLVNVIPICN